MKGAEFAFYSLVARRHHQPQSEFPYHAGARTRNRERFDLPLRDVWEIMCSLFFVSWAFKLKIHSFVLMPNHFHMIASTPEANLSEAMRFLQTETSRAIGEKTGRINQTWGSRYFRCVIPQHHYFLHAYKYVYRNPIEAGLVRHVEDYEFSTLSGLLGFNRLHIPTVEDTLLFGGGLEETLRWLNTKPTHEGKGDVQLALRKSIFKLPKASSSQNPLETGML